MSRNQKIIIRNDFQKPLILCVEPWATEYGMLPNDEFEIISEDTKDDFYFHIVLNNERIIIFVEGGEVDYPQIYQDGEMLDFGHQRDLLEQIK